MTQGRLVSTRSPRVASGKENAPTLRTVRRRRGKCSDAWCQAPLLDVGFDEDEPSLAKIYVDTAGSIGAHGWEQVVVHESSERVIHLPAVPGVEHCSGAGAVTNT